MKAAGSTPPASASSPPAANGASRPGPTPAASSPPPGRTCRCPQSPRKPSPERRFVPPAQAPPRATPEEPSADPATTKPSRMRASILNGNRARRQEGGENGYADPTYGPELLRRLANQNPPSQRWK